MSWITITESHIADGVNGPLLQAARTAALNEGQSDPLPTELARVTREVRGRAAACAKNTLGPAGTIPDEAESAAIDIVVYRLCKRVDESLVTKEKTDAKDAAERFLVALARCEVAIEQPETVSEEVTAGAAGEIVSTTCRKTTRAKLDRL